MHAKGAAAEKKGDEQQTCGEFIVRGKPVEVLMGTWDPRKDLLRTRCERSR